MYTCYICKVHHTSCLLLFRHLKFDHGLYPGRSLRLKCGEPGCSFVFCTYSGYQRNLSRAHKDCLDPDPVSSFEFEPVAGPSTPVNVYTGVTTHVPVEKKSILDMCSSVIAQVQASGVPESTVQ